MNVEAPHGTASRQAELLRRARRVLAGGASGSSPCRPKWTSSWPTAGPGTWWTPTAATSSTIHLGSGPAFLGTGIRRSSPLCSAR